MRPPVSTAVLLLAAAGCGGGGSGSAPALVSPGAPGGGAPPPQSAPGPSAGGIWHGVTTDNETLTFLLAEDGTLRVLINPTATMGPGFGAGAAIVTAGDQVSGSYGARRLPLFALSLLTGGETCSFAGSLRERTSMALSIDCLDDAGITRSASLIMGYNGDYETDASLPAIAGNYTLPFRADTNVLTIGDDGVIFGIYHNGPACTVNGLVTVVHPSYNLYRFEWQLSGCSEPFSRFNGAPFVGLGYREPRGAPAGSFLMVLTGLVDARLESISVLYERT